MLLQGGVAATHKLPVVPAMRGSALPLVGRILLFAGSSSDSEPCAGLSLLY